MINILGLEGGGGFHTLYHVNSIILSLKEQNIGHFVHLVLALLMARVSITGIIDKTKYKSAQNVFNAAWNGIIDVESFNNCWPS